MGYASRSEECLITPLTPFIYERTMSFYLRN